MRHARCAIVAAAVVLASAPPASADPIVVVQVANPTALSASPLVVEDFEDDTFLTGLGFEGVRRVTSQAAASGVTTSGTFGVISSTSPAGPIDIFFSQPIVSMGLTFGNDAPEVGQFTAFLDAFAASTFVGSVGVPANMNDFADQFIGFNSSVAISRVRFRFGAIDVYGVTPFIDDVTFGPSTTTPATTPEPMSLLLFATGLAGVAARCRRMT
jgi:hypothetical protein